MGEGSLLKLHVRVQIDLGRFHRFMSQPQSNDADIHASPQEEPLRLRDARCAGLPFLRTSDGHACPAFTACFDTRRCSASALRPATA